MANGLNTFDEEMICLNDFFGSFDVLQLETVFSEIFQCFLVDDLVNSLLSESIIFLMSFSSGLPSLLIFWLFDWYT